MSNYIGLEFVDGSTQVVRVLPYDLMAFERANGRTPNGIEDTLRLVYSAIHRVGGGGNGADFDAWAMQIADFDDDPEVESVPLDEAASTTT